MPRIGFSYQPEPNTVVRGGFGLFFDSVATFYLSGGNSGSTNNATLTPRQRFSATTNFLNRLDAGVQRNFTVFEQLQLQVRTEAIDMLNHPVYTAPSTDWTSTSFGQITMQANQPRVYQFGAFLRF